MAQHVRCMRAYWTDSVFRGKKDIFNKEIINCSNRVFLTLLGGGVFGNPTAWIEAATIRACTKLAHLPLEVYLCYQGEIDVPLRLRIDDALFPRKPLAAQFLGSEPPEFTEEQIQQAREKLAAGKYVPILLRRAVIQRESSA